MDTIGRIDLAGMKKNHHSCVISGDAPGDEKDIQPKGVFNPLPRIIAEHMLSIWNQHATAMIWGRGIKGEGVWRVPAAPPHPALSPTRDYAARTHVGCDAQSRTEGEG